MLVRKISETCHIPAAYLAKIVNALARKRLVITQRGVGGGVVLARGPGDISLHDVCSALQDPVLEPRCVLGNHSCLDHPACPAHGFCANLRAQLAEFLRRTTIADMVAFEAQRGGSSVQTNGTPVPPAAEA